MAKKKAAKKKELAIIKEEVINGAKIITYEDGSVDVIPAPIHFTPEDWAKLQDEDDDDSDEDDDDSDDDDSDSDEDDEPLTGEDLAKMDFEELEDVCDDKELDTDPDDFDEDEIEKFRKQVAKELGLKLPKAAAKGKGKKGKK